MLRRLMAFLAALSLALCLAAIVLWWRSWAHAAADEDRLSWRGGGGKRYTLRSDMGQLALFSPPRGNPAALPLYGTRTPENVKQFAQTATRPSPQAWDAARPPVRVGIDPPLDQVLAELRNDQISWCTSLSRDETGPVRVQVLVCRG